MTDKKIFLRAGYWVIFIYILNQIVRLGSNLILTRLLEPEMFGIMAIVNVLLFGIAMFSDLGLNQYIVRSKNPEDPRLLNIVWTMHLFRGLGLFILIELLGLTIALLQNYYPELFKEAYSDTNLPILICISGLNSLIHGFQSLAFPVYSRRMQRGKIELVEFFSGSIGVLVMLIWASVSPSIWVLVSAGLVSSLLNTILSYRVFPIRHRIVWDKEVVKEVFHFGKWILIATMLTYIFSNGDRLFLAGKISPTMLGVYSIAFMLSTTLKSITETLAGKLVFPFFAKTVHENRTILKDRYYKIRLYYDGTMFFLVGFIAITSPAIIDILYDERYQQASWMLQILIFSVIGTSLSSFGLECLAALSITKVSMWVMLIRSITLFAGLPIFFGFYGLVGALWVIVVNVFISLPVIYWALHKQGIFSLYKEFRMLPAILVGWGIGVLFLNIWPAIQTLILRIFA